MIGTAIAVALCGLAAAAICYLTAKAVWLGKVHIGWANDRTVTRNANPARYFVALAWNGLLIMALVRTILWFLGWIEP